MNLLRKFHVIRYSKWETLLLWRSHVQYTPNNYFPLSSKLPLRLQTCSIFFGGTSTLQPLLRDVIAAMLRALTKDFLVCIFNMAQLPRRCCLNLSGLAASYQYYPHPSPLSSALFLSYPFALCQLAKYRLVFLLLLSSFLFLVLYSCFSFFFFFGALFMSFSLILILSSLRYSWRRGARARVGRSNKWTGFSSW